MTSTLASTRSCRCSDWYGEYYGGKQTDPEGPASGSNQMNRGGSWHIPAVDCRSAARFSRGPWIRYHDLGFRLALVPSGQDK
jgi:formylglycine-generating enzyme required for sulfatase activity